LASDFRHKYLFPGRAASYVKNYIPVPM